MATGLITLSGPGVALTAGAPPGLLPAREQIALLLGFHTLRTTDAANVTGLWWSYLGVLLVCVAMIVCVVVVLRSMARRELDP